MATRILTLSRGSTQLTTRLRSATPALPVLSHRIQRFSSVADIDSRKIAVQRVATPKPKIPNDTLVFGRYFSDHMLDIDWTTEDGWSNPRIIPFQNLSLNPAVTCLHYALECFEGMKAYIDDNNKIRMFRPTKNMKRFNKSASRLHLPNFNGEELLKCIKELLKIEKSWIPRGFGYSLYIRPTLISTTPIIGVNPPKHAKLFVILSPVGPYYKEGFKAVNLYADPNNVRAWPGGTGDIKCGGNYALSIDAQKKAEALGFTQVLWLYGAEHYITEVGTMNQFFFWKRPDGKKELITAPLDGTILDGVTRDSILNLTREWKEFEVSDGRPYSIHEVIKACEEGRMIEAFGAGTAAIVSPVKSVHFSGKTYKIPLDPSNATSEAGPLAKKISETLLSIQYGKVPHEWSVVVD